MIRSMFVAVAMFAATGCSGTSEPGSKVSQPEAFAGVWRSVTPSLEFIRLSVDSKSSEIGVLAARLTLSGVAWEGGGRIDGDSLVARMGIPGSAVPSGVIVARARDAQTLRVQLRPAAATPTDLTFVREN
jgi:hypothetical protein